MSSVWLSIHCNLNEIDSLRVIDALDTSGGVSKAFSIAAKFQEIPSQGLGSSTGLLGLLLDV